MTTHENFVWNLKAKKQPIGEFWTCQHCGQTNIPMEEAELHEEICVGEAKPCLIESCKDRRFLEDGTPYCSLPSMGCSRNNSLHSKHKKEVET